MFSPPPPPPFIPSPITSGDVNLLNNFYSGQVPLRVGMVNQQNDRARGVRYNPPVDQNVAALRKQAEYLQARINQRRLSGLGSEDSGEELGFLSTPEYFLNQSYYLPGEGGAKKEAVQNWKNYKNQIKQISKDNPDVILNPVGMYSKDIDYSNPHKMKKFTDSMTNLHGTLNSHFQHYQNYNDKTKSVEERNKSIPFIQHSLDPNSSITRNYKDLSKLPLDDFLDRVTDPTAGVKGVKNKSNFYYKGNKIGSYTKSHYFNEVTPQMGARGEMGWQLGDKRMHNVADAHLRDPSKTPVSPETSAFSKKFMDNVIQQICFDRIKQATPSENIPWYMLNSEMVNTQGGNLNPVSTYTDRAMLRNFHNIDSDPTREDFIGDDPEALDNANIIADLRPGAPHPFAHARMAHIPDVPGYPKIEEFTESDGSKYDSMSHRVQPFPWPLVVNKNTSATANVPYPVGLDPTHPVFYNAHTDEFDSKPNFHGRGEYSTHAAYAFNPFYFPAPGVRNPPPMMPPLPPLLKPAP